MNNLYFCKCSRTFQKNSSSTTTGYRLERYAPEHECFGCPYVCKIAEWDRSHKNQIPLRYECRGSKLIRYDSYAGLSLGNKNVGCIYSLDFKFLHQIRDLADSLPGIEPDRYAFSCRPSDYGADGRYRLTIYPTQNKAGIEAKQKIFDRFFAPDGSRKEITPEQEKEIILEQIRKAKEEAQSLNTYYAPCGHKFNRAAGGAAYVTIEVTGTAFSLGCFSCEHGRTEQGEKNQGPKVFCRCIKKAATQIKPTQDAQPQKGTRYSKHILVYFVGQREDNGLYTVFMNAKCHPSTETLTKCATIPDFPTFEQAQNALDGYAMKWGFQVDAQSTNDNPSLITDESEERKGMGKLNLNNISAGLDKVKSVAESLANVSHFELIPLEYITPAEHNPFSENDNDQSRYEVAMSIQANGLIEPLVVNKKSDEKYTLISGEHRFTAIKQYLSDQFKNVQCMVFEGLSDDEAELKLYEANNHREYTPEQRFKRYQELEALLQRMKESGTYHGGIQKGLAERLGVSTRQVRKYQTIMQLPAEKQQAVIHGNLSINDASRVSPQRPSPLTREKPAEESGTSSAFSRSPANPDDQAVPPSVVEHGEETKLAEEIDHCFWDSKIEAAIKRQYDASDIFKYYIFQVPTTQDAIRDKLKSRYGSLGGSVDFPDKQSGLYDMRSGSIEITCGRKNIRLTYSQVDDYIRKMIRHGELISKERIISLLSEKFHMNQDG